MDLKADGLPDPPLDAVAHDSFAKRARSGEPDTGTCRALRLAQAERRKKRPRKAGALVVNSTEVL